MTYFKPSSRRYYALRVSVIMFGVAFATVIVSELTTPSSAGRVWPLALLSASIVTAGAILRFGSPAAVLTEEQIQGHSRWGFLTTLPFSTINVDKSRATKASLFHWLLRNFEIYATDGKSLSISRLAFEPKQFDQLLETISTRQKEVSE